MFLKAYVKDSSLEDLIWSDSYKSRAAHQLKSISSMQRAEEPFTPYPNFVSLVGSQAGRATGASPEPFSPGKPHCARAGLCLITDPGHFGDSDPRDQRGDDKRTDKEQNGVCCVGDTCVTRAAAWVRCG